jgi:hypothetical protein
MINFTEDGEPLMNERATLESRPAEPAVEQEKLKETMDR